jgi:hypothetical protein
MVNIPEEEFLVHYGILRKSGRYPWGSGEDQATRNASFLGMIEGYKKQGYNETQIAKSMGITTTELRSARSLIRNERKQDEIHFAEKLKEKQLSNVAIAQRMKEAGYNVKGESRVRDLLKPSQSIKADVLGNVTATLRKAVDEKKYIDVGAGVEFQLGISTTKLRTALQVLKEEGYLVHPINLPQLGTGKQTNMKVLVKPGTEWGEVQKNRALIKQVTDYSDDGGHTVLNMLPPLSIHPSRVGIRYAEQGGTDADGVMYIRNGPKDLSLGGNRYAQVRVLVGDKHYLKGMAIYKDDMPDGVDILFNTNKSDTGNKLDALKKITDDPDNPFGATVRQIGERGDPTKPLRVTKLTSAMNLVNGEGSWNDWSKSVSSQVLSKQRPALAKEQLDLTYIRKQKELEGILALTNPSVKKTLLDKYADSADSAAVHLKAAALPRQKTQVLLPVSEMKEHEVFAPGFKNGDVVALVRFPHGGTFEIPQLTVNNRNPAALKLIGPDAKDAIGIHPKVAERLSGADFDGDSVLVIPNNLGKIKSSAPLAGLDNFDPKVQYRAYPGMKPMTAKDKGMQMGLVSNLITDMTIGGANRDELAHAVKHSMVVIDAEKHNLDFRRSAQDNGISALMKKYQNSAQGGASTLISRATSPKKVLDRKERSAADGGPIDPKTGKKVYTYTDKLRPDADGKLIPKTLTSTKLGEAEDAHTLSSGTVIEKVYADHSNRLKALANQARKELVAIKSRPYSPAAKKAYASDVETLNAKLTRALQNAPLERQAQVFANGTVRLKVQANPHLKDPEYKDEYRRMKSQALAAARARTGADKQTLTITDTEWAAIQAGAITAHKLDKILTYADLDRIKALATPKAETKMKPGDVAKANSLRARGYTWAEVAESLGVSVTTAMRETGTTEDGD